MNPPPELPARLAENRLLSAAVITEVDHAVPLASALLAGGLDIMEVTFRHPHAAECIRRIRAEVPDMQVGAGTLLSTAQINEARSAGATFGLSPGYNPTVVEAAASDAFPFIPGVATPGEIERALERGCETVKVFPIHALGGVTFLDALLGPYHHTPLRIVPLGGINEQNLASYISHPLVVAAGGSWLTDPKLATTGQWEQITAMARRARTIAQASRS